MWIVFLKIDITIWDIYCRCIEVEMDNTFLNGQNDHECVLPQFLFVNIVLTQACFQSSGMTKMLRLTESLCISTLCNCATLCTASRSHDSSP